MSSLVSFLISIDFLVIVRYMSLMYTQAAHSAFVIKCMNPALTSGLGAGTSLALWTQLLRAFDSPVPPYDLICPAAGLTFTCRVWFWASSLASF